MAELRFTKGQTHSDRTEHPLSIDIFHPVRKNIGKGRSTKN